MKVFLDMVGCRLNQSELENFARQFRLAGHTLTSDVGQSDLAVINTCTVTAAAASDSRQKIRQAGRSGTRQIVLTGCWASLNQAEAARFPGVTQVIGNLEKDDLVARVLNLDPHEFAGRTVQRQPIPGARLRTRAFIKVQDGCDNHCTYCITTLARGKARSRPLHDVLEDVRYAMQGGSLEVVLTGVHLGSWGHEFTPPSQLSILVDAILTKTDLPRLRLSSLEPWDISPEFFRLWQNQRLCRHLHLPLQSGCTATLKRMGRRISPGDYSALLQQARTLIPGVAITTDIITGFPGETEAEFADSVAFIRKMAFAGGHVFTYSARPGTAAAKLPGIVPQSLAKTRNALIRSLFRECRLAYLEAQLGQDLMVLWEKAIPLGAQRWQLSGLSDTYLRLQGDMPTPCYNQIMRVRLTSIKSGELVGEVGPAYSRDLETEDKI